MNLEKMSLESTNTSIEREKETITSILMVQFRWSLFNKYPGISWCPVYWRWEYGNIFRHICKCRFIIINRYYFIYRVRDITLCATGKLDFHFFSKKKLLCCLCFHLFLLFRSKIQITITYMCVLLYNTNIQKRKQNQMKQKIFSTKCKNRVVVSLLVYLKMVIIMFFFCFSELFTCSIFHRVLICIGLGSLSLFSTYTYNLNQFKIHARHFDVICLHFSAILLDCEWITIRNKIWKWWKQFARTWRIVFTAMQTLQKFVAFIWMRGRRDCWVFPIYPLVNCNDRTYKRNENRIKSKTVLIKFEYLQAYKRFEFDVSSQSLKCRYLCLRNV